jgi:hypothetical protein
VLTNPYSVDFNFEEEIVAADVGMRYGERKTGNVELNSNLSINWKASHVLKISDSAKEIIPVHPSPSEFPYS